MKGLAPLAIGATGAMMYDRDDSRSQRLGALFVYGAIFNLLNLKEPV